MSCWIEGIDPALARLGLPTDNAIVDGSAVTLIGGAFVAIITVAAVLRSLFHARKARGARLGVAASLAMVPVMIGWLMMWFTQEPIWSTVPKGCTAFASIELKGHVHRTCSYLVHRYQAGEWLFYVGLAVFAACIGLSRLAKRQPQGSA